MKDCIFCKIANKELSSDIVYEDREILGFKNIQPESPVHLLFIPKKHIEWRDKFSKRDLSLLDGLVSAAKKVAIEQNIFGACKFIFNIGKTGHIAHIHLHLLGGWREGEIPSYNI
jgi:histidine triad (HIT) family protein